MYLPLQMFHCVFDSFIFFSQHFQLLGLFFALRILSSYYSLILIEPLPLDAHLPLEVPLGIGQLFVLLGDL